jgi:hypothetical protein
MVSGLGLENDNRGNHLSMSAGDSDPQKPALFGILQESAPFVL